MGTCRYAPSGWCDDNLCVVGPCKLGPNASIKGNTMKYEIAQGSTAEHLMEVVRGLILEGFVPIGGVSVAMTVSSHENERKGYTENYTDYIYAQAMTQVNPRDVT